MMLNPHLAAVVREDFPSFVAKFFQIVNPGTAFKNNWHIDAMAFDVDRMRDGSLRKLLVTMPPRCSKSYIFSVALPAFLLGHAPATRIVTVSHADTLAETHSNMTRRLMESELYRELFPNTILAKATQRELQTTEGGIRLSATIGGALTGLGGGWFIVDDPLNASNAYSEPLRKQANDFFDHTLVSRADDPNTARFIIVMQRLHEDDLAGHVLAQGGWEQLKLQARATEEITVDLGSGRQHHVKPGELLHSARLDEAVLAERLTQMGSAMFEAQYQQNPLPAAGNQIKREWLARYTTPPPREGAIVVQSWDTAVKTAVENDFSVCTTWLHKEGISYLLDVWRGKVDFPALRDRFVALYQLHAPSHVLIEDAGSGTSLIQDLRAAGRFNIIPRRSSLSKQARVDAISGTIEAGRIKFPEEAPWMGEFERELLAFPGGRHDDQVDSVSQYGAWADERFSSSLFEADFGFDAPFTSESLAQHILTIRGLR